MHCGKKTLSVSLTKRRQHRPKASPQRSIRHDQVSDIVNAKRKGARVGVEKGKGKMCRGREALLFHLKKGMQKLENVHGH